MENDSKRKKYSEVKKVSIVGIIGNIILLCIKMVVAILSKSQGLIADTANSASDILTSLVTFLGNKLANKPKDREHPYGHDKLQYIASVLISFIMFTLGISIFKDSIKSVIKLKSVEYAEYVIVICFVTIIIKFLMFLYAKMMYSKNNNLLIKSAYLDHRNDIFTSISVIIGVICSYFGIAIVDGIVGIAISILVIISAIKIFVSSYNVLMDTDITDDEKEAIKNKIESMKICLVDCIKVVHSGTTSVLAIEISLDKNTKLDEAHLVADKVRNKIVDFDKIDEVIVHVNPK